MSIIIQAGHESSSSESLMKLLYSRGLKKPILSNVQQLTGKEIADILNKIISEKRNGSNNKLAENIVVDFLLANIYQDNWGWADSKNLISLSYWQSFEPDTQFALVFDHPKKIISQFAGKELTLGKLDSLMKEWLAYHSTMLNFFEAHPDKCLLLEGDFSIKHVAKTKKLFEKLSSSLVLESGWKVKDSSVKVSNLVQSSSDIAYSVMTEEILKNYPEVVDVFNSLLSKADLKGSTVVYKTKRSDLGTLVAAVTDIRNLKIDLENQYHVINHLEKDCKATEILKLENENLTASLLKAQEVIQKLSEEKNYIGNTVNNSKVVDNKNEELFLENNALITTLHSLQESIERMVAGNESTNTIDQKLLLNSQILEKENKWLVDELHNTQNLLEKKCLVPKSSHINEIEQSNRNIQSSKIVSVYHTPESRVKNDFSYRLGAALVKTKTIKDIVSLPVIVVKEYSDYLQIKEELENLPPLDKEVDILQTAKIKNHLSYRVGNTITRSMKSPKKIVRLPIDIGKEILNFKR